MVKYIYSHDYNYVWLAMQDMVKWASYSVIKMKFFPSYLSLGGKLRCCTKADVIPCPEGNTTSLKYSHAAGALAMSPSFSIGIEPFFWGICGKLVCDRHPAWTAVHKQSYYRPVIRGGGFGGFVRTPVFANTPTNNTNPPPPPQTFQQYMGKAHKNCTIGKLFCLHHITGTAFITRLKLYVYIVEDTDTF